MKKTALCVVFFLTSCAMAGPSARPADVRISNSNLLAICFAGKPINDGKRSWSVTEPVSMTFTMRNQPRSGVDNHDPGIAVVSFTGSRPQVRDRGSRRCGRVLDARLDEGRVAAGRTRSHHRPDRQQRSGVD